MRDRALGTVFKSVRTLFEAGTSASLSDGQLLERYVFEADQEGAEAAFRALVERHGPVVMRTCRLVVRDVHDAEDAFQATFLILARKAATIRKRDSVAGWLVGVARRVACRAQAQKKRRSAHESLHGSMAEAYGSESDQPGKPMPEVREEVDRLPERYRAPIVLCYWNGLTHEQAATQLRVPASTVRVRLLRGRLRLRERLIRRGLTPAVFAGLSGGRAGVQIPARLVNEIMAAATRVAAGRAAGAKTPVAVLVEGIIRAMFYAKLKTAAVLMAALVVASILMMSSLAGPTPSKRGTASLTGAAATAVPEEQAAPAGDGRVVTAETLKRSRWERITSQPATVVAFASVDVYAKTSGYLKMQKVDLGSRVKRGELFAEIEDPELLIAVDKARAEVGRAEARVGKARAALVVSQAGMKTTQARIKAAASALDESEVSSKEKKLQSDRMKDLVKRGAVEQRLADEQAGRYESAVANSDTLRSQLLVAKAASVETEAKIEEAKADVAEAEADLRIAQSGLRNAEVIAGYTRLVAPFDGVVTRRSFHVGQLVPSPTMANASPVVTIVQTQTMRVLVYVPDRDAPYLDVGDHARVTIDALGDRGVFEGVVARTGYAYDATDRTLRAEIDLSNEEGRLRPGQFGRATIDLTTKENVLTIPSSAIREFGAPGQESVCYRVVGGHAVRTRVKLGDRDGNRIEVLEGLKEGDVVIAKDTGGLSDGQAVTVK
jgi:HlyD family secretion protein